MDSIEVSLHVQIHRTTLEMRHHSGQSSYGIAKKPGYGGLDGAQPIFDGVQKLEDIAKDMRRVATRSS